MKRHDISRLEKNRNLHLKLGFVIAISLVTLAFNYTSDPPAPYEREVTELEQEDAIPVVRTAHKKKRQLPPPMLKLTKEIIPDEAEFIEEPEPRPLDNVISIEPVKTPEPQSFVPSVHPPKPQILPEDNELTKAIPEIFDVVEHMPLFGNCAKQEMSKEEKKQCSAIAIFKYMGKHIKYPAIARENNIQGTVVIRFVVNEFGEISQPEIVRDIGGGCGQEALRVVKNMPVWEPGRQRDRKVKVYFNLPVKFRLD